MKSLAETILSQMRHSSTPSNSFKTLRCHRAMASAILPLWLARKAVTDNSHLRSLPSVTPTCKHDMPAATKPANPADVQFPSYSIHIYLQLLHAGVPGRQGCICWLLEIKAVHRLQAILDNWSIMTLHRRENYMLWPASKFDHMRVYT